MANVLPAEKRLRVLGALVEGNSERACERMTEVSRPTISRFALLLGVGSRWLHDGLARDLQISEIQADEIWSYVQKKEARVTPADGPDVGEAYTFTALGDSSRFVITWHVGKRDQASTNAFIADLRARLLVMPSMTSDGFAPYISAIGASFGPGVDYGQTIKNYTKGGRREGGDDHRYEPPRNPFITKKAIFGAPDMSRASTAYIERNNGTMRHHIGRMRRLCYAFSKDLDHHKAAVALCYAHYNLCLVVKTLRVTPAMAAGVTDHVWELPEFLDAVLSARAPAPLVPVSLPHRTPAGTSRELPGGRGFLRLVGGTSSPASPSPGPAPASPAASPASIPWEADEDFDVLDDAIKRSAEVDARAAVAVASSGPTTSSGPQLDLLSWVRPPEKPAGPRRMAQLDLFGGALESPKGGPQT